MESGDTIRRRVDERHPYLFACAILGMLTLAMFGDLLFASGDAVVSHQTGDTSLYFSRLRPFGFSELFQGNLVLWNPHTFSGTPFLGGFQSAMLYPPNLIYGVLPLARAINVDVALHSFLVGFFTFAWAYNRGMRPIAALFAAVIPMYAGAYTMRIYVGQLTMVSAQAWTPLLFLCVDKIFDQARKKRPLLPWSLLGIFAVTVQVFAGYPHTVFVTAIAVGIYCVLMLPTAKERPHIMLALGAIAIAPLCTTAIQLWTGIAAGQESLRTGDASYEFSTSFSFPPENLLTFFAPGFFGDVTHVDYWGRWAFWDTSAFLGIIALTLAIYGALFGDRALRRFSTPIAALLLVIALGRYTPAFRFIFEWVPGFAQFRAPSKFMYPVSLFAAMLAGVGVDLLLKSGRRAGWISLLALLWAGALAAGAIAVRIASSGDPEESAWRRMLEDLKSSDEVWRWGATRELFFTNTENFAFQALVIGAVTCVIAAAMLYGASKFRPLVYALVALGIIEIFAYARAYRATYNLSENYRPEISAFYEEHKGEHRVFDLPGLDHAARNFAIEAREHAMWGYDPVVLRRYGEFMAFAQGKENRRTWDLDRRPPNGPWPSEYHPILRLLRCRYLIPPIGSLKEIEEVDGALPHYFLVQDYKVVEDEDSAFAALEEEGFDPLKTVVLESTPSPAPEASEARATLRIVDRSTDHMTFECDLDKAAILVVTDVYSEGWRAVALPGSVQSQYEVLPADFVLRAIPLTAGHHAFRLEYSPLSYRLGRAFSIISLLIFATAVAYSVFRRPKAEDPSIFSKA